MGSGTRLLPPPERTPSSSSRRPGTQTMETPPPTFTSHNGHAHSRGNPHRKGRGKRRKSSKSKASTAGPTTVPINAATICGAVCLTGLLGSSLNVAYVAYQTALRWELDTATADFITLHAPEFPLEQRPPPLPEDPHKQAPPDNNNNSDDPYADKEPILDLLEDAKLTPIDRPTAAQLPTWTAVTALYGAAPRLYYGMDQGACQKFQQAGAAAQHFLATAGTFNSGTNLLAELLLANCHMPARMAAYGKKQRGIRWQVVWGKHTPVGNETFRQLHRTYTDMPELTADDVFAAVMIRDPYRWMQSMCKHPYAASWPHATPQHCPALVPNAMDQRQNPIDNNHMDHIPVHVKYSNFTRHYESLVHFWNNWYQEYLNATFPYVLVRFEDLIYHPKQVVQSVCECAGGAMNPGPFKYITGSAKKGVGAHGAESERTGYLQALSRYGTSKGRTNGMDEADLQYARQHLDAKLMKEFQYRYHDEV